MNIRNALTRARKWIAGALLSLSALLGIIAIPPADSAGTTAQDVLSWTMPTQNTDGSPLALAEITKSTVAWGTTPGGPYPNVQDVPAPATTVTLTRPNEGYGRRCYRVSVTSTVQGLWSAEGCKTVTAPPNAPTGLQVN